MPPGKLRTLSDTEATDQFFFLKQADQYGPIFKTWWTNKFTVCIVGHELGRKFLTSNEGKIRAATIDLTPLFPNGFLRAMEGETHRKYRKMFIQAFRETPIQRHDADVREIIAEALHAIGQKQTPSIAELRQILKSATTAISLRLILGIERSSPLYPGISASYDIYAPDAPFLVVKDRHRKAYELLKQQVAEWVSSEATFKKAPPSLLRALVVAGNADDTAIGNLIQMTEASLYDMHGLWCWIVHMLATDTEFSQGNQNKANLADYAVAVARETLRMEQSEFVLRTTTADIVFDGYLIPRRSRIRICVWEGHRDPKNFSNPSKFDPGRFAGNMPGIDSYSPFGLDKHRCLGADWTVVLASAFTQQLLETYRLNLLDSGPPEAGKFHFEPSSRFSVQFLPRE